MNAEIESWQTQIDQLTRMIEVSGIPSTSLMGRMLTSSLNQVAHAYRCQDWQSVERGLANTRNLLLQCVM